MHTESSRTAFTLVELAIVLVIIGLIVGGVLVGQDLINAARLRSVVTDLERYNAGATTFRLKYGNLPGDLLNTKAVQFGFNVTASDTARDGAYAQGDGNGSIDSCTGGQTWPIGCEPMLFWVDLSKAGLIPFKSKQDSTTPMPNLSLTNAELGDGILPKTKLRDNILMMVIEYWGAGHYFAVGDFAYVSLSTEKTADQSGLTPLEAQSLDKKLDDGEPLTGTIIPFYDNYLGADTAGGPSLCISADSHYNTGTETLANSPACAIFIHASF